MSHDAQKRHPLLDVNGQVEIQIGDYCPADEQQHFREHLEETSRLVASWPEWKRDIFGYGANEPHPTAWKRT